MEGVVDLAAQVRDVGLRQAPWNNIGGTILVTAVAANFEMMTRIADGTGTPLDAGTVSVSEEIRSDLGINDYTSARLPG